MSGEQDDAWQIERVLLTLKGHRQSEVPPTATPITTDPSAAEGSR